ncbi:MAG: hypothetical protein K2X93_06760 [Candidatus Obscuribacterales bacterium]|nr:hypothetical protein [Candidatus Obscuribacterales bacterium]
MFGQWLKNRIDFNDNDKSDLDEIAECGANFISAATHAINTVDMPSLVVHARSAVEAFQAGLFHLGEVPKSFDQAKVEAAKLEIEKASTKAWNLFMSFQPHVDAKHPKKLEG